MRTSKISALAIAIATVITISGCSQQFRSDASHSGFNAYESILNTSNISHVSTLWRSNTSGAILSSPAVALVNLSGTDTLVTLVTSTDGQLYAYRAYGCGNATCGALWSRFVGANTISSPAVGYPTIGGTQVTAAYVVGGDGFLHAFDVATGNDLWPKVGVGGPFAGSSPNFANNVIYLVGGDTSGRLDAHDATTGAVLWVGGVNSNTASPAVGYGNVYVGDDNGIFYAYNASGCGFSNCFPVWTANGLGMLKSSPAVANNVVYIGSEDGNLYAFDAHGCSPSTHCSPLWHGVTPGPMDGSPAVANGKVYIVSGDGNPAHGNLYVFDAAGVTNCSGGVCNPIWTGALHGVFPNSSPTIANGVVYVGSDDGHLYMFDETHCVGMFPCTALASVQTNETGSVPLSSSPTVASGWIYIGSSDKHLYGIAQTPCGIDCAVADTPHSVL